MATIDTNALRQWVAKGKIKQAITTLRGQADNLPNELHNECLGLSARWSTYERNERGGLKSTTELALELRQINNNLLSLLDVIDEQALDPNAPFALSCSTNKGSEHPLFNAGERLQLYVQVNKECWLRVIYEQTDGKRFSLYDNHHIAGNQVGRRIALGPGFEVQAPYGSEHFYFYAQDSQFAPITDADIQSLLKDTDTDTRGLVPISYEAESKLTFTTQAGG